VPVKSLAEATDNKGNREVLIKKTPLSHKLGGTICNLIYMIKYFLFLFFAFSMLQCKWGPEKTTFFGQVVPDSVPVIFAPDEISLTGRLEQGFSISRDGREILFGVIGGGDTLNCIYYTTLKKGKFLKPVKPVFIDDDSVFFPMFSPDSKKLTFTKRHVNSMQTDIWFCEKENNLWSGPKQFPDEINSVYREGSSCLTWNNTLYFTSNRDTAHGCCGDIYRSQLVNNDYSCAGLVDNINTIYDEEGVFVSPKEDFMIVQSWIADYHTKHDLYISYRTKKNTWTGTERLNSLINTTDLEQRPFVTFDNKCLFFNRFELDSNFNAVESDIYWVSTKKVFKPYVYNPVPDTMVKLGNEFKIKIPKDLFKDIDDTLIDYSICVDEGSRADWLHVDNKGLLISGIPRQVGDYLITILATDKNRNQSKTSFKLIVRN
jgi:hypothetical protein